MQGKFVEKVRQVCKEWFGENPEESPDLCRVVSDRHFDRLESLISSSTGRIAFGKYLIFDHNSMFECCSAKYESYQTDCFDTSYKSTLQVWLF